MSAPTSSSRPEQLSLFKTPLRVRLKARLKNLPFRLFLIVVWFVGLLKLLEITFTLINIYEYGYLDELHLRERREFLWFLWLVLLLLFLLLTRKGFWGKGRPTKSVKLAAGAALFVYIIEATLTTLRLQMISVSGGLPWSFYVLGPTLAILTLWKLPALQLAQWKDKLETKDYLTLVNGTRTILLQLIGGAIVIAGLYYTAQNMSIAQENVRLSLLREDTDRLNQAISQLKDESPEVRLVAIHNLQAVAVKSESNYRLITTIFRRYVRLHAMGNAPNNQAGPGSVENRADIQSIVSFLSAKEYALQAAQNDNARSAYGINPSLLSELRPYRLMKGTDLRATDLRGLEFSDSMWEWVLSSANLEKSSLRGISLSSAMLDGANLSGSDLTHALLFDADLRGANLTGANLEGVVLSDADVEGADFTDTNLTVEQIRRARNYEKAKLPPSVLAGLKKDIP